MRITYNGHSEFTLISAAGLRIVLDPCDPNVGYGAGKVRCDIVTMSHGHHDHNYVEKCLGDPLTVTDRTLHTPDVKITPIHTYHDGEMGAKRGDNYLMKIEMDNLSLLHCGDLGHVPDEDTLRQIGHVDVLMVPVGGFYTIDAAQAAEVTRKIAPRIVIPMHFKTSVNADWPIAGVDAFMDAINAFQYEREEMPLLRVTKGDLSEHRGVCLLKNRPHEEN